MEPEKAGLPPERDKPGKKWQNRKRERNTGRELLKMIDSRCQICNICHWVFPFWIWYMTVMTGIPEGFCVSYQKTSRYKDTPCGILDLVCIETVRKKILGLAAQRHSRILTTCCLEACLGSSQGGKDHHTLEKI